MAMGVSASNKAVSGDKAGLKKIANKALKNILYFYKNAYHSWSVKYSSRVGVSGRKRNPELIVSLTTIPERIDKVAMCLDSLLRQNVKPDKIILWVDEDQIGNGKEKSITFPDSFKSLKRRGVEVKWCKDVGPYTKIIPSLKNYPNSIIVTADDDILYPRNWLKMLYEAYVREPGFIHCHRAHLMKYDASGKVAPYRQWHLRSKGVVGPSMDLFPTGVGGVLYAPGHLHPEVVNEQAFLELCPKADDVWLKAMSMLANVPCKKVRGKSFLTIEIKIPDNRTLMADNVGAGGNDLQIAQVSRKYGVFASSGRCA